MRKGKRWKLSWYRKGDKRRGNRGKKVKRNDGGSE
jgi:hypothetical protein